MQRLMSAAYYPKEPQLRNV